MPDLLGIAAVLLVGFLFAAALAPLEALGWWAGWYGRERNSTLPGNTMVAENPKAQHYLVFLTGIHSVSHDTYSRREIAFLEMLGNKLPETVILEVFPYSVTNRALTGQRFFAWFWRVALKLKLSRLGFAGFVINLRNVFQVAVSADRRYGPIYNQGSADMIVASLRQRGYQVGSGTPIILVGYSGGGQIAVGAAAYIKDMTQAPITVISLGGIMCADPGILELERLVHLAGRRDYVQRLGSVFFPGRWALFPYSSWNLAKYSGILQIINMGPVDHTGKDGYLDAQVHLPDGRSYLGQTVDTIVDIVRSVDNLRS